MHTFHLTLHEWAAFSPSRVHPGEWSEWALGTGNPQTGEYKADLPDVPAMLRRRLSGMGKAALWCAGRVLESNTGPKPFTGIFCSQHGEVSRTVTLLQDLAELSSLSPASFSLSVHNAIGGIFSIAGGFQHPITALSAGPDSPFAALLEAWSQLQYRRISGDEGGRALCVIYDDVLPQEVGGSETSGGDVQALAMLVSCDKGQADEVGHQGAGCRLSFVLDATSAAEPESADGVAVDELLRFLLDPGRNSLRYEGDGRRWHWFKHGAPRVGQ